MNILNHPNTDISDDDKAASWTEIQDDVDHETFIIQKSSLIWIALVR